MNYHENQQQEINTIKPRTITINLSDADISRLYEKTGSVGLTPAALLESFIGDLVDGTYSNGSDEREYANAWFNRCGFADQSPDTFLRYMLGIEELDILLSTLADVDAIKEEIEDILADDSVSTAERQEAVVPLVQIHGEYQEEIETYFENFKGAVKDSVSAIPAEYSLEDEINKIIKWKAQKDTMIFWSYLPGTN